VSYLIYTCETGDPLHYHVRHLHMTYMLLCWVIWLVYFRVFILFYYIYMITGFPALLFTDLYQHYMFICTYAPDTVFYACFPIQIYRYTWFTAVPLIFFMLLVIACTCMPEPHHLIMHTYDCLSTPTGFIICTRRVAFWQPWILISRSWSLDRGGLVVVDQSAQQKRGLAVVCPDLLSSNLPLIGLWDSHLANREYFLAFHIVHPTFALLGDLIFLIYCIILCDNYVLALLLLECILPMCFCTLILAYTEA